MIESLYFTAAFLVIVVVIAILACYMDRRNEKADKAERRRIAECTHSHGFLTVKVFGHPDLKKCVDCERIFELDGTEVDLDYLEDFIENTDRWIENSDGGRELKIYLTREQFRKIYRISMERKMTMDDMVAEMKYNKS